MVYWVMEFSKNDEACRLLKQITRHAVAIGTRTEYTNQQINCLRLVRDIMRELHPSGKPHDKIAEYLIECGWDISNHSDRA